MCGGQNVCGLVFYIEKRDENDSNTTKIQYKLS